MTKSGKQMSPQWVDDRLDKAVGPIEAQKIRDADFDGEMKRVLINVDEHGNATPTIFGDDEP